jgi:hypothetical protein
VDSALRAGEGMIPNGQEKDEMRSHGVGFRHAA